MFEKGTLRTLAAAETLIKLIQETKMKELDEKMENLIKPQTQKQQRDKLNKLLKNRTIPYNKGKHQHTSLKQKQKQRPTYL